MARDLTYKMAQAYVKDKDKYVCTFVDYSLSKLQAMFHYEGLPETIPEQELERLLLTNGQCLLAKVDGDLYALSGSPGGEPDPYGQPTKYVVANAALRLSKTYELDVDSVLIQNDYMSLGMLPILYKYAVLMCDTEISLNTVATLTRLTTFLSAGDDKTKVSAEIFMNKILAGDLAIIAERNFLDNGGGGVQTHSGMTGNTSIITSLIELFQYYKASFFNDIGLNANYNMKREYVNENEAALNIDALLPLMDNMLHQRRIALEEANNLFGTDMHVDFMSVWKATHEQAEKATINAITTYGDGDIEELGISPIGTDPVIPDPTTPSLSDGEENESTIGNDKEYIENDNQGLKPSNTFESNDTSDDSEDATMDKENDLSNRDESSLDDTKETKSNGEQSNTGSYDDNKTGEVESNDDETKQHTKA